jgi:opacity protein-like surface antigen
MRSTTVVQRSDGVTHTKPAAWLRVIVLALLASISSPAQSSAKDFASAIVGYDFNGHLYCRTIAGSGRCSSLFERADQNLDLAVSFGRLGNLLGSEFEIAYASESETALGPIIGVVSSYLSVMGNAMVAPQLGPIRPYALVGAGLIRENLEFTGPTSARPVHRNHFGLDAGGGLMGFVSEHVCLRGDIRYFRLLGDVFGEEFVDIQGAKTDFSRVSGGIIFKF